MPDNDNKNPELARLEKLLEDIGAKMEATDADGKVISITEAFKMFPELKAKYEDLEKRFVELETKVRERKTAGLPGVEDEKQKFSFLRAFRAIRSGNWNNAGFEKEIFQNMQRAGSTTDDAGGGYLVPTQAIPDFIELLRAETVCIAMGASVLDGLVGSPVIMPKQTGGATVYWIGENTSITPSDLTFGQLQLTPKKVAALVQLSNELVNLASPSAEALVRQDLAAQVGLSMDLKYLRGTGSSGEPLGIANTPGINSYADSGGNGFLPDWVTPWADMEYELAIDKALRGRLGFVFHPALKKNLKKLRNPYYSGDAGGEYPILPLTDEQIASAIGYPFKQSTELPINLTVGSATAKCTQIFFGNWRELLIGMWQGVSIAVSDVAGTAFAADQTWFRIIANTDCALRHAESFCLCGDAKVTA